MNAYRKSSFALPIITVLALSGTLRAGQDEGVSTRRTVEQSVLVVRHGEISLPDADRKTPMPSQDTAEAESQRPAGHAVDSVERSVLVHRPRPEEASDQDRAESEEIRQEDEKTPPEPPAQNVAPQPNRPVWVSIRTIHADPTSRAWSVHKSRAWGFHPHSLRYHPKRYRGYRMRYSWTYHPAPGGPYHPKRDWTYHPH